MQAHSILIVEDSSPFSTVLTQLLQPEYKIEAAASVSEAKRKLREMRFDLVLLDLGLPDGSGMDLCSEIRRSSSLPILILSGRTDPSAKAESLDLGADDYLDKPFNAEELRARIRVRLRTRPRPVEALPSVPCGGFRIDHGLHKVFLNDSDMQLSPLEFRIFAVLFERPGVPHSRAQLITKTSGVGHHVSRRSIDAHICSLRNKLGKAYLRTIWGVGYVLDIKN